MVGLDEVAPRVAQSPLVDPKEQLPHANGRVQCQGLLAFLPREAESVLVGILELVVVAEFFPQRRKLLLHRAHGVAIQPLEAPEKLILGVLSHGCCGHVSGKRRGGGAEDRGGSAIRDPRDVRGIRSRSPGDHQGDRVAGVHAKVVAEPSYALRHHKVLVLVLVPLEDLLQHRRLDVAVLHPLGEDVLDCPLQVPVVRAQDARGQALTGREG